MSPFRRRSTRRGEERGDAPEPDPAALARDAVLAYHQRTKHDFHSYARGPGYLDWDSQPDPFRRWSGAREVALEVLPAPDAPSFEDALAGRTVPAPLDGRALSRLLLDALGITAWKSAGDSTWALRANPSSGNLHPTEAHVIAPAIEGVSSRPFVAHYAPRAHALEVRAELDAAAWAPFAAGLPPGALLVVFSTVPWREAWKYGERAWRYCNHDTGHAIAALAVSAAGLGWRVEAWDAPGTEDLSSALQLPGGAEADGPELEHGDVALVVAPRGASSHALDPAALSALAEVPLTGTPSVLSPDHVPWDAVYACEEAARKPRSESAEPGAQPRGCAPWWGDRNRPLADLIRRRRSAVAMDGATSLSREAFHGCLAATLPSPDHPVLAALPLPNAIDLALFVHRVDGLDPGLYLLVRDPARREALRAATRDEFAWERPDATPDAFDLVLLWRGDVRGMAARVSCQQEIAGAGAFSLGMIADLSAVEERGAWAYPRLFWESGAIGQLLYLEAHAAGVSATGIGCFFDDPVHHLLGLTTRRFQSLYHFTVGGAVHDPRVTSLPAYPAPDPSS